MKGFCPLASGSKGNCIYVGSDKYKVLIDAGISTKAIKEKLATLNVAIEEIDAILITHDHADHIQGLKTLAFKMGKPLIANTETAKGIVNFFHDCPKFKIFATGEPFDFGDMRIHPFSVPHDTVDPVAFVIEMCGHKLGFCTDLGYATSLVKNKLQLCDYLYLEANHQPEMVHASARPSFLKQRILSRSGHLSNADCGMLLAEVAHINLKGVHLAHLSRDCNSPEKALSVVRETLAGHGIALPLTVARQETPSQAVTL